MKKLRSRRGEMLVESLISMLIIAMTGLMLAMAAASALRANAQAAQTTAFASVSSGGATVGKFAASLEDGENAVSIGSVEIREQGGLYYYVRSGD